MPYAICHMPYAMGVTAPPILGCGFHWSRSSIDNFKLRTGRLDTQFTDLVPHAEILSVKLPFTSPISLVRDS